MWGLRLKAEDVTVGDVIGDCGEVALEARRVGEPEVFAAGEMGDGLGDVATETVSGCDSGHLGQSEGRRKLSETVVGLDGAVAGRVGIRVRIIFAHASARRVGMVVLHP